MRKYTMLYAGILAVLTCFRINSHAGVDDHMWIRVEGKHFRTSALASPSNQIFIPVGVAANKGISDQLINFCKTHGLNTVRLSFQTNNPNGGEYDFDAQIARIAAWVELAKQNQIYTVLDNHHVLGGPWEAWWGNEGEIDRYLNNYAQLAEYFKDEPWILGYEVMNEAYSRRISGFGDQEVYNHLRNCALRIREKDTRHILFLPFDHHLEPHFYPNGFDPADFDVLDTPQVAITPHYYPCHSTTTDGFAKLTSLDAWRTANNAPVFVTEFCGGALGNGYTYDHNKQWLQSFMNGLDHYGIGWTIWSYSPGGGLFPTTYAPDDPEIWRTTALAMGARYPVPSNSQTASAVVVEAEPRWFPGVATGEELQITVRIVDGAGSTATGSDASISLSISGPGTLQNTPSNVTGGKAAVTVQAGNTEGTITVTAASAGLTTGSLELPVTPRWSGFQVKTNDGTWTDGNGTDALSPQCRVLVRDRANGVNLRTARYEYTTSGGESWVYWDSTASDEFSSPLDTSRWTAQDVNSTGGSAEVSDGVLTLRGKGDAWSTWTNTWYLTSTYAKDEYYCIHEEKTGDFEIVTKINSQDNTDPMAMAGIFARNDMVGSRYNGYALVAVTPENGFMFAWKDLGHMINGGDPNASSKYENHKYIDARFITGTTTYPCYLKLEKTMHPSHYEAAPGTYNRNMQIYSGYYSTDGRNWTLIGSRVVYHARNTQRAGLFVTSGNSSTQGGAVFDFYRNALSAEVSVDVTANHAVVLMGGVEPYSVSSEYLTTAAIPFDTESDYSQKIRFKIRSQVPILDYVNNPGEQFVSPEYTVYNGIDVSAKHAIADARRFGLWANSTGGAVRIAYTLPDEKISGLTFSVFGVNGRKIWSKTITDCSGSGFVVWNGNAGNPVAAGTYIIRMTAHPRNSNQSRVLQTKMICR